MPVRKWMIVVFLICSSSVCAQKTDRSRLIERLKPSVVWIHAFAWPSVVPGPAALTGSGYVVADDLIMTSFHVIRKSTGMVVYSASRSEYPLFAYPVWFDSSLDLALIRTTQKAGLRALTIASIESMNIGDDVLVLGYPVASFDPGAIRAVSGMISSERQDSTIEIDTRVDVGIVGGPCVNSAGEVIGTVCLESGRSADDRGGYVSSARFVETALGSAMRAEYGNVMNDAVGTRDVSAYGKLCEAQFMIGKAAAAKENAEKRRLIQLAREKLSGAIEHDRAYAVALYFRASCFLQEALIFCIADDGERASYLVGNFDKDLREAIQLRSSLASLDETETMRLFVDDGKINCKRLTAYVKINYSEQDESYDRERELKDYPGHRTPPPVWNRTIQGQPGSPPSVTTEVKPIEKTILVKLLEYTRPVVRLSFAFRGKPLFNSGKGEIAARDFEMSAHVYEGYRLSGGLYSSGGGDLVAHAGFSTRYYFGHYTISKRPYLMRTPLWIAGLRLDEVDIALGQMRVTPESNRGSDQEADVPVPEVSQPVSSLFAHLKLPLTLNEHLDITLSGNYPFENGNEEYQIGVGAILYVY